MSYTYNLDGSVASVTYPSGATITYTPDSAGRVISAVNKDNSVNYVTGGKYNSTNALTDSIYGSSSGNFSGIINSFSYNNRLQPVTLWSSSPVRTLMYLVYDFHLGGGDNGNVWGITNNRDTTRSQSFTYDALNRLISAQNTGTDCSVKLLGGATKFWGNSYGYDAWGNLLGKTPTKCSAENLSVTVNVNNQLQGGYTYDAAGNMTHDATASLDYGYDPENRIKGAAGFAYSYDADGNRVEKANGATGTLYWYMTPGIVAESDLAGNLKSEYVFFDGERVARKDFPGNTVSYYFSDQLKTASVITDAVGNIKSESDYSPWGRELSFLSNDSNHYKFTGKERDSETSNDYFGARYNSSSMGRFLTPDPLGGEKIDPQTLNKYSYVRNNPINLIDPTGLYTCADQADCKSKQDIAFEKARQNDLRSKDGDVVRAAQAYGDPTKDGPGGNKVNVSFADLDKKGEGGTTTSTVGADDKGNLFAKSEVVINSKISGSALDGTVGHEGSHVADAQDVVKSITYGAVDFKVGQDITRYQSEQRAYRVTDSILRSENESNRFYCGASDCILGRGTMPGQLPEQVDRILANSPNYRSNGQPLSPANQGGSVVNGLTVPH